MSDFKDACTIPVLLAQHAPLEQAMELGQLQDRLGFAPSQALELSEPDPCRDYIRQVLEQFAMRDKAV